MRDGAGDEIRTHAPQRAAVFETVSVATWIPRLECGNIGTRAYEFNANGVYEKSN